VAANSQQIEVDELRGLFRLFKGRWGEEVEWVQVEEIEGWIEDRVREIFRDVYSQGNAIRLRVGERALAVKRAAEELSQAKLQEDELNRPLMPTIRNTRDKLTIRIVDAMSRLDPPEVGCFEDLMKCCEASARAIEQVNRALSTHGRVVASFTGGVRRLLKEFKRLKLEADRLSKVVDSVEERVVEVDALRSDAVRLRRYAAEAADAEMVVDEAQMAVVEAEGEEERLTAEFDMITRSEAFQASSRVMQETGELEEELRSYRMEFDTSFSKLKRPIDKYIHIVRLSRDEESMLKRYVESPSDALTVDEGLRVGRSLGDLKRVVGEGVVAVKNPDKTIQHIDRIQRNLDEKRRRILSLLRRVKSLNESLVNSPIADAEAIGRRLEKKRCERGEQLRLMEKRRSEAEAALQRVEGVAKDIEKQIWELFRRRVEVII